jgi:mono/diheme cytochrome c family protein
MTNGWPCWKGRRLYIAALFGALGAILWVVYWWATLPRTPEALFQVRCSACHELRTARVCEFPPHLRPAIVDTMRRLHGADKVISSDEALAIGRYLEDSLICP